MIQGPYLSIFFIGQDSSVIQVGILMSQYIPFKMSSPFQILDPGGSASHSTDIHPLTVIESGTKAKIVSIHGDSQVNVQRGDRKIRIKFLDHLQIGLTRSDLLGDHLFHPVTRIVFRILKDLIEHRAFFRYLSILYDLFKLVILLQILKLPLFDDGCQSIMRRTIILFSLEDLTEMYLC